MKFPLSRRHLFQLVFATTALAVLSGNGSLHAQPEFEPSNVITQLAPGLTLQSVQTLAPTGPLRFWIVKADPKQIDLGLEIADQTNVVRKRSVRNLAAQSKAIVAINGGFFAFGGAAVGAVKADNVWQRLPWRNRTAMGWNEKGALISPLQGNLQIDLRRGAQSLARSEAALNGFTLPGQRVAINDGFILLTPQFKPTYVLQNNETAAAIKNGKIVGFYADKAEVPLQTQDYLLVARGTESPWLLAGGDTAPDNLRVQIQSTPAIWNDYPTIVGAGPRLVANGRAQTNEIEEEFQPDVIARGPRTAVGWDKDNNWLFLVADGRQQISVGLTIPETAVLFAQMGAIEAMNLDGGSSTQLIVNGELANTPSALDPVDPTHRREVQVSNALTFKLK